MLVWRVFLFRHDLGVKVSETRSIVSAKFTASTLPPDIKETNGPHGLASTEKHRQSSLSIQKARFVASVTSNPREKLIETNLTSCFFSTASVISMLNA